MNQMTETVTAVIPAYNEERHIGGVLNVLTQLEDLSQIIVVDDGSQDETAAIVWDWRMADTRIELIQLEENQGKGGAVFAGATAAENDLVLFLDADLMELRPCHVPLLINPVRQDECAMTLGVFEHGRWRTDLSHRYLPFLSGQRCLRWSLFRNLFQGPTARWSIETAFNLHAWYHNYRVRHIPWPGVTHAIRTEKHEPLSEYGSYVKMWWQIIGYIARFFLNYGWHSSYRRPPHRLHTSEPDLLPIK
jgi:glycosyltransferase involved in cell wall biosynthesis